VFTTNRNRRSAAVSALTCAALMSAGTGVAVAMPAEDYYSSYTTPADDAGLVQEQYFSSYGSPEPLAAPQATGGTGDDTPWLEITLSTAGALVLAGVGATQVRRVRIRRRRVAEAGL
jgi:hypothetical protein